MEQPHLQDLSETEPEIGLPLNEEVGLIESFFAYGKQYLQTVAFGLGIAISSLAIAPSVISAEDLKPVEKSVDSSAYDKETQAVNERLAFDLSKIAKKVNFRVRLAVDVGEKGNYVIHIGQSHNAPVGNSILSRDGVPDTNPVVLNMLQCQSDIVTILEDIAKEKDKGINDLGRIFCEGVADKPCQSARWAKYRTLIDVVRSQDISGTSSIEEYMKRIDEAESSARALHPKEDAFGSGFSHYIMDIVENKWKDCRSALENKESRTAGEDELLVFLREAPKAYEMQKRGLGKYAMGIAELFLLEERVEAVYPATTRKATEPALVHAEMIKDLGAQLSLTKEKLEKQALLTAMSQEYKTLMTLAGRPREDAAIEMLKKYANTEKNQLTIIVFGNDHKLGESLKASDLDMGLIEVRPNYIDISDFKKDDGK